MSNDRPTAENGLLPCCRGEGECQAPPDIGPCDPLPSAEKDAPCGHVTEPCIDARKRCPDCGATPCCHHVATCRHARFEDGLNDTAESDARTIPWHRQDEIRRGADDEIAELLSAWCLCGFVDDLGDGTCGNCGLPIMTADDETRVLPPAEGDA